MESLESKVESLPKKIFVEIGTNSLSIPKVGKKEFRDNEQYFGVDKNFGDTRKSSDWQSSEHVHFLTADAKQLPFENKTVDSVFMGNVFGDPSITEEDKSQFIEEAKRILTDSGELIIKENSTPAFYSEFSNRKEYLEHLAETHGLIIEKFIEVGTSEWEDAIRKYDSLSSPTESSGAFLSFLKKI